MASQPDPHGAMVAAKLCVPSPARPPPTPSPRHGAASLGPLLHRAHAAAPSSPSPRRPRRGAPRAPAPAAIAPVAGATSPRRRAPRPAGVAPSAARPPSSIAPDTIDLELQCPAFVRAPVTKLREQPWPWMPPAASSLKLRRAQASESTGSTSPNPRRWPSLFLLRRTMTTSAIPPACTPAAPSFRLLAKEMTSSTQPR